MLQRQLKQARCFSVVLLLVFCVVQAEARSLRSTADAICAEAARTGSPTTLRACETVKALRGSRGHTAAAQSVAASVQGVSPGEAAGRVDAVKEAISWAFDGYEKYAWGHDELMPLSKGGMDSFCASGATVIDSLSTLWLADLPDRFARARAWVAAKDFTTLRGCNLFESNIRVLGGLLSAGALSGDPMFFEKAESVAKMMVPSFGTPAGIPCNSYPGGGGCSSANLAEVGTLVMEWTYLAQVTKTEAYQKQAEGAMRAVMKARNNGGCIPGIYGSTVSTHNGASMARCWGSMGGGADSFYEYLIKIYLLTRKDPTFLPYKRAWDLSMDTFTSRFLRCSDRGHLYITSGDEHSFASDTEHLACFLGGNLVQGDPDKFTHAAAAVTESCVAMYTSTRSKLGSDGVNWQGSHPASACLDAPKGHEGADVSLRSAYNLQRPETVESLFFLWRTTRNPRYRELGWLIMKEINQTRVESGGFASVRDVGADNIVGQLLDKQESFFIAEELKYLLLLFQEDSEMRFDPNEWVFNTEAHPLPKFTPLFPSSIGDVCEGAPYVCTQDVV